MTAINRRIILQRRPTGIPVADDFALSASPLPALQPGEMLIQNKILSMDAAIRGWLDDRPSYIEPNALGDVVRGMTLGQVVDSRLAGYQAGDYVRCLAGWEDYSVIGAEALGLEPCRIEHPDQLSLYMGTLGPTGLTAYVGLHAIAQIRPGETVVISAAAGAVGNVAGQLARLHGCTVIGITGGPEKVAVCQDLGFDHVIDYKATPDLATAIDAVAPAGVDVYFDNVGGAILDTMLLKLRISARVVICGMIANYNNADDPYPIRNLWQLLVKRATMRGFLTYEHPDHVAEAHRRLGQWVKSGELRPLENIRSGLEATPDAFIDLMSGKTVGKTIVALTA